MMMDILIESYLFHDFEFFIKHHTIIPPIHTFPKYSHTHHITIPHPDTFSKYPNIHHPIIYPLIQSQITLIISITLLSAIIPPPKPPSYPIHHTPSSHRPTHSQTTHIDHTIILHTHTPPNHLHTHHITISPTHPFTKHPHIHHTTISPPLVLNAPPVLNAPQTVKLKKKFSTFAINSIFFL